MRFLIPCAIFLSVTSVNAETTSGAPETAPTAAQSNPNIQQATQTVAKRLIDLLNLSSVSESEQSSISLKAVVIKALGEGKPMTEIRAATNQALSEVTQQTTPPATPSPKVEAAPSAPVSAVGIAINPAEVTVDPATGKMMATVQPGESIFRLAQRVYGRENGDMYIEIFAANTDKIKDINVVVQGQVLVMP